MNAANKTVSSSHARAQIAFSARPLLLAAFVVLALMASVAHAAVTITGDWPADGALYKIEVYDATQVSPCDGVNETGSLLYNSTFLAGNSAYDSNDEYNGTFDIAADPTTLSIYFCKSPSSKMIEYSRSTANGSSLEIDFGKIEGVSNLAGLRGKYVHACDALSGGNNTTSEAVITDGSTGAYTQYYYLNEPSVTINGGNNPNLYVFFDSDDLSKCTFDDTIKGGLHVLPNSALPYNYGVYASTYLTNTLINSTAHGDIKSTGYIKVQHTGGTSNNEFVGMTGELTGGAGEYDLYYKAPTDGSLTAYVYTGAVPDTAADETITGVDKAATSLDLSRKISGNVPSDVAYVETNISSIIYNVSASSNAYALYIPNGTTPNVFFKNSTGGTVYNYTYGAAIGADKTLSVGKISGYLHPEVGSVGIYENANCSVNTNTSAQNIVLSGGAYTAYILIDNGGATAVKFYPKITNGATNTCEPGVNLPAASTYAAEANYTVLINGIVPGGSSFVGGVSLDLDNNNAYTSGTDPYTNDFINTPPAESYRLYVTSQSAAHNVTLFSDVSLSTLELRREKTANANTSMNVSEVNWNTANVHADLTSNPDDIKVYEYGVESAMSSETRNLNVSDTQYYEVPSSNKVVIRDYRSGVLQFYVDNYTTVANQSRVFEPSAKVTKTAPASVSYWQITGGAVFTAYVSSLDNIYVDNSTSGGGYTYKAYNSSLVLSRGSKNTTTASTWLVNEVTGDRTSIHDDLDSGTWNAVVDEIGVGQSSSETVNIGGGAGTYMQFYEDTAAANFNINITDGASNRYYIYNHDPGAGGAKILTYRPNVKLNVSAPGGIQSVEAIDNIGGITYRDATQPFVLYVNNSTNFTINVYSGAGFTGLLLTRTGTNLSSDYNFTVGEINGSCANIHADLTTGGNHYVRVVNDYSNPATWTAYSSGNINLTNGCSSYTQYYEQPFGTVDIVITNDTNVSFAIDNYAPTATPDIMTLEPKTKLTVSTSIANPSAKFILPSASLGSGTAAATIVVDNAGVRVPLTAIYLPAATNYNFSLYDAVNFTGTNVLLRTGKSVSGDTQTWNTAKVTGASANMHVDLIDGTHLVYVYNSTGTSIVSGVAGGTQSATVPTTGSSYTLYYDVDDAGASGAFILTNSTGAVKVRYIYSGPSHAGAGSVTFEPDAKIDAVYPSGVASFEYYKNATITYRINSSENSGDTYVDASYTPYTFKAYSDDAYATQVLGRNAKVVAAGNSTWNIAKVTGASANMHADLIDGTRRIYIYNTTDNVAVSGIQGGTNYSTIPVTGSSYTIFYDVDDAGASMYATITTSGNAVLSRFNYNGAQHAGAGSLTYEPNAKIDATYPASLQSFKYNDGFYDYTIAATENSGDTYVYVFGGTFTYYAYSDTAWSTLELNRTGKTPTAGNNTWNVSEVHWATANVHVDLSGGTADNMKVYDMSNNLMSSETRTFGADDIQYYETPSSLKVQFRLYSDLGVLGSYVNNFTTAPAQSQLYEPSVKVTMTEPAAVNAWEITGGSTFATYRGGDDDAIYVDKTEEGLMGATYTYKAYVSSDLVLSRGTKDAGTDSAFNVNSVTSSVHSDLDTLVDPLVVYTSAGTIANCTGSALSSTTSLAMNSSASYLKYYERLDGNNVVLKLTYGSYVSCINTLVAAASAGGNNNYNLSIKTNGTMSQGIITVYIDSDPTGDDDISQTAVAGNPALYAIYWAGDAASDISFYDATPTMQLNINGVNLSADRTINVGKVNGTSHTDMTTAQVYSNTACTALLSSETTGQSFAGTYYRYFEDIGTRYLGVSDGTFTTCGQNNFTLTNEEATVNMTKMVNGSVPSQTVAGTDLLTAGANLTGGAGDDYQATIPNSAAPRPYKLFLDENAGTGDRINFYSDAISAADLELDRAVNFTTTNTTFNVAKLYSVAGTTHANINKIEVCSDYPTNYTNSCTAVYSKTGGEGITSSNYDAFFEQPTASTTYYARVNDTAYVSYRAFTTSAFGDSTANALDGLLDGTVTELYDGTTPIANVNITLSQTGGDTFRGRTYSLSNGTYRAYSDTASNNYRAKYVRRGYITATTDALVLSTTNNVNLSTNIVVHVTDSGGNPINDATVSIFSCTTSSPATCTAIATTCLNPSGSCNRSASNNATGYYFFADDVADGSYVQVRATRAPFDTMFDPAVNASVNLHATSSSAAVAPTEILAVTAPSCTLSMAGGANTYSASGVLYAKASSGVVTFTADCAGQTSYTVVGDLSQIGLSATQAFANAGTGVYNYTATLGAVADGTKNISVNVSNSQLSSIYHASLVVDSTAPAVTAISPSSLQNTRSVTLSATTDGAAACRYSASDVAYSSMTGVMAGADTLHEIMVLAANGANTYYVRCTDLAGNAMGASNSTTFTVDAIAPTITAVTPSYNATPYNATGLGTIAITTDVNASCKWGSSDASFANMASGPISATAGIPATLTGATASQGLNLIYVRCQSTGGSSVEMSSSGLISFNYDSVAPTYEFTSISSSGGMSSGGVAYAKVGDTLTLRFSASETVIGTPSVTIGGAAMTYVNYSGGTYTYTRTLAGTETTTAIIAISGGADAAGNAATAYSDAGANAEFDFTAPVLSAPLPTSTQNSRSFLASVNATTGLTCRYSVNTGTFALMEGSLADMTTGIYQGTVSVPSDGSYTVYFACRDLAGNVNTSNTGSFTVDATAPTVLWITPQGGHNSTSITVEAFTDVGANCAWDVLDGSGYAAMNYAFTTGQGTTSHSTAVSSAFYQQGINHIYVACQDLNGVDMASSVLSYFYYDSIAPSVFSWGTTTNTTSKIVKAWIISGEELNASSLMMTFDGSNMTYFFGNGSVYTFSYNYTGITSGTHNITASACADLAGNACVLEPGYFPMQVTIDETAPTATAAYDITHQKLTVNTSESATCMYDYSNVSYSAMSYAMSGSGTAHSVTEPPYQSSSAYYVYVRCMDGYSNAMGDSVAVDIHSDTVAPSITGSAPSGIYTSLTAPTLSINTSENASCQYATSAFAWGSGTNMTGATTTHTASLGSLSDNTYSYYVLCQDTSGNTMASGFPITFVVNTAGNFNYTYSLNLGWNSFWLPRIVLQNLSSFNDSNYSVVNVLETKGNLTGSYAYMYYRNATSCPAQNGSCWLSYDPASSVNDLSVFNDWDNLPYWISMNASGKRLAFT